MNGSSRRLQSMTTTFSWWGWESLLGLEETQVQDVQVQSDAQVQGAPVQNAQIQDALVYEDVQVQVALVHETRVQDAQTGSEELKVEKSYSSRKVDLITSRNQTRLQFTHETS